MTNKFTLLSFLLLLTTFTSAIAQVTNIKGLAVAVGYSDSPANVNLTTLDSMLNQPTGFTDWSNNGSVNEYFSTMSNGKVNITAEVIRVDLDQNYNYYHGQNLPYDGGQELVNDVVEKINNLRPQGFTGLTIKPGTNQLWHFTILSFGNSGGGVAYGIRDNNSITNNGVSLEINNVAVNRYSNLTPDINVVCHEMGHSVFGWSDYYGTGSPLSTNIGHYGVMGSGGNTGSPMPVNPAFRIEKGWVDNIIDISNVSTQTYTANSNDYNQVYKYTNPNNSKEYILIEPNTHSRYYLSLTGDNYVPDEGLTLWYIDEDGGFDRPGVSDRPFIRVIQADGEDEMHDVSKTHRDLRGDGSDLFNDDYPDFSANTTYFRWKDGSLPGLILNNISAPDSTMSFTVVKGNTVVVTTNIDGEISPKGNLNVSNGSNLTFTMTPDIGYEQAPLYVDGSYIPASSSYSLNNINENHFITAEFIPSETQDQLPSPWTGTDIGNVNATGVSGYRSGAFGITSYGNDIWGNSDAFHYVHQPLNGNGEIVVHISEQNKPNVWSKSGVMIRETLASGSKQFMVVQTGDAGVAPQFRTQTNGGSVNNPEGVEDLGDLKNVEWLKVKRSGDTFTAYYSNNGSSWTLIQTATISMQNNVFIGLCASGASSTVANKTVFDQVTVNTESIPDLLSDFDVPRTSAIPQGFLQFSHVYTIGNGPDLSNVHNSVFNWWGNSSNPNGLYQFTLETDNGNPRSFTDLIQYSSYSLAQSSPEITINSNTGFSGLQGSYWVNKIGNDLVLVEKSGDYALYFTQSSTPPNAKVAELNSNEVSKIRAYPNPFSGSSIIEVNEETPSDVLVTDTEGKIIESYDQVTGDLKIGDNYKPGCYLVKVVTGGNSKFLKVVKF